MRKKYVFLLFAASVCMMAGCGKGNVSDVQIDYGDSAIYSKEDMDEAIAVIKDEFNTSQWSGFDLNHISYSSDDKCDPDDLGWLRDLAEAEHKSEDFSQCIMFESDFHTPEDAYGTWNADSDYYDYQWWLVRTDDSGWEVLATGYC